MKITAIRATPVLILLEAPYLWSYGALDGFTKCVVEVETADGVTGIGEAPSHGSARLIEGFADRLIGLDALDIAGLERRVLPWMPPSHSVTDHALRGAWGGVEIALWDLRGKLWGQPVANLLGGVQRRRDWFHRLFQLPAAAGWQGRRARGRRGGGLLPRPPRGAWDDVVRGQGVRPRPQRQHPAGGRAAGCAWRRCDDPDRQQPGVQPAVVPASRAGVSGTGRAELGRSYPRLDGDEAAARPDHDPLFRPQHRSWQGVAYGVPDAIVSDVAGFGGFSAAMRFVSAAAGAGVDFWCYSGGSGLETAAYLQLCAAHPHIREPNQSLLRQQPFDVIAEGPFAPKSNVIALPDGPGLGVTLDPDRLRFAANLLKDRGVPNKYHDPGAPGLMRRMPLI